MVKYIFTILHMSGHLQLVSSIAAHFVMLFKPLISPVDRGLSPIIIPAKTSLAVVISPGLITRSKFLFDIFLSCRQIKGNSFTEFLKIYVGLRNKFSYFFFGECQISKRVLENSGKLYKRNFTHKKLPRNRVFCVTADQLNRRLSICFLVFSFLRFCSLF